jgi:large subunit ribosomal protein L25
MFGRYSVNQKAKQVGLSAEKRTVVGKQVKQLRRQGWTPGVMYGHGYESVPLKFEMRELQRLLSETGGSQLIGIKIKGQSQPETALVRDVQRDPIRQTILHVDFYRVKMTERLTTEIPLELIGESPVAARNEGILLQGISSIEVECLPGDLVDAIEVDLSDLVELDQALYVRDLAIPSGIDVLTEPDEMIARVTPLAEEEAFEVELEEVAIPEAAEVEVITEAQEPEIAEE